VRRDRGLAGRIAVVLLAAAAPACSFDGQATDRDAPPGDDAPPVADAPPVIDSDPEDPDAPVVPPDANEPPDAMLPPDAAGCPGGYEQLEGSTSWYRVQQTPAVWVDAEADCENDGPGTHLVIVDSAAEYAPINAAFFGQLWVGVTDRVTEGTFVTVTGAIPTYLPFGGGQPDDFFGQDCLRWGDGGGVDDIDCLSNQLGYVCECDGVAPDPAAY
jgi:hypothetical protein